MSIPSPCLNAGLCSQNENIPGNYTCQCTSQFKGHNCEQRNNRTCADNPCLNNAEACLDKQSKYYIFLLVKYRKKFRFNFFLINIFQMISTMKTTFVIVQPYSKESIVRLNVTFVRKISVLVKMELPAYLMMPNL